MEKRLLKCLRRVEARKSIPDFDAWCDLAAQGYIETTGPSDDIETVITAKGQAALHERNDIQREGKP